MQTRSVCIAVKRLNAIANALQATKVDRRTLQERAIARAIETAHADVQVAAHSLIELIRVQSGLDLPKVYPTPYRVAVGLETGYADAIAMGAL